MSQNKTEHFSARLPQGSKQLIERLYTEYKAACLKLKKDPKSKGEWLVNQVRHNK